MSDIALGQSAPAQSVLRVGGTAYNAALAFKKAGFAPLVFGKVGEDLHGRMIRRELTDKDIPHALVVDPNQATGLCNIVNYADGDDYRTIFFSVPNANDYDIISLTDTLQAASISGDDYIFFSTYIFPQVSYDLEHCRAFCDVLKRSPARLIVDIVPHKLYESISLQNLSGCLGSSVYLIIAELRTLLSFIAARSTSIGETPNDDDYRAILKSFDAEFYAIRFGNGNISKQSVLTRSPHGQPVFLKEAYTAGFENLQQSEKRAFGDTLTAELLGEILDYEARSQLRKERI